MSQYSFSQSKNDRIYCGNQDREPVLTSEYCNELGKRIKAFRKKRGLTQEQAAELLGYSVNNVKRLEHGESLTLDNILRICQYYRCTIEEIFPAELIKYVSPFGNVLSGIDGLNLLVIKSELERISNSKNSERR